MTCTRSSMRWVWSRLWSFQVQNSPSAPSTSRERGVSWLGKSSRNAMQEETCQASHPVGPAVGVAGLRVRSRCARWRTLGGGAGSLEGGPSAWLRRSRGRKADGGLGAAEAHCVFRARRRPSTAECRRFRRVALAVTGVVLVAIAGGVTYAVADIGGGGVINGCYKSQNGQLRLIDPASDSCLPSETAISWSQTGPRLGSPVHPRRGR